MWKKTIKKYTCSCGKNFGNSQSFNAHKGHCGKSRTKRIYVSPNKGKNKNNCERIKKQTETYKKRYDAGEIKIWCQGKHLSESTKEKLRQARLNYLVKNQKIVSGWTKKAENKMTKGEEIFYNLLIENKLIEKYDIFYQRMFEHKFVFDFVFENIKLDVEIDGQMHFINGTERIEWDRKRDEFVKNHGWNVYRIRAMDLVKNPNKIFDQFLSDLNKHDLNKKLYNADNCSIFSNAKRIM